MFKNGVTHSVVCVFISITLTILFLLQARIAASAVITADAVWQNEQLLTEDILVPPGVTLTIRPGTLIKVSPAESTKTDPEFISPLTEITVRGRIRIEGTPEAPVRFLSAEAGKGKEWAGILVDNGEAEVDNCVISGADSALYLLDSRLVARTVTLSGNRHGLTVIGSNTKVSLAYSTLRDNDYGLVVVSGPEPVLTGTVVSGNRKKDRWQEKLPTVPKTLKVEAPLTQTPVSRIYSNEALRGDTVWRGRVRIEGTLRIPEGARLLIAPGTVIEFSRKDTNGDKIGENGILIQGAVIAKGTPQAPIIFRSAEKTRQPGDWDSVNLMNSDKAENLFEHCIFEDAYRGLHFHYSTVKVSGARFSNNFRGIQFQESAVEITGSEFTANRSGVQGRNSLVSFTGNRLFENHQGVNFFRNNITFSANRVSGSRKEAVRIREGIADVSRNIISGNRFGLLLTDIYYGKVSGNLLANNSETGMAMRSVDNIEVSNNYLGKNGANGLNLQEARGEIKGNLLVFNSERGIGITSFTGRITGNSFAGNGLYAIDLESDEDVDANGNWWGGDTPSTVVFDNKRDRARGNVLAQTVSAQPEAFMWPLDEFAGDITLSGDIIIENHPEVPKGSSLTVSPGTTVRFSSGAGLKVTGGLTSAGTPEKPVRFTALTGTLPGSWDEITIEQALDSTISHTLIEYATWGIHSHFTNLVVDHLLARRNLGGVRFRSGPVTIRQSVFRENSIGIRSYIGNGVIEENVITANEVGLFVRERGSGLKIRRNNFSANTEYNIRSGDFNTEDIPAGDNWWGEGDPLATIFDGRSEEGVGKVLFEPCLKTPVTLDSAGTRWPEKK
jgi:nitrous oxidase accessory protein NosD